MLDASAAECETKFNDERDKLKEELKRETTEELKPVLIEEVVVEAEERIPADDEEDTNIPWTRVNCRNHATPSLREIIFEEMNEQQQIELIKKNLVIAGIQETL